jgi:hypothetical protein
MKPLEVLNYLCQNNLIPSYPNTVVAQRILLSVSRCSQWGKEFLQININKIKEKHFKGRHFEELHHTEKRKSTARP